MTKTAKEVIKKLKAHLARHGVPDQLVSDNGQPFASVSFQEFADIYNFEHVTSSPTYPQSNGKVEGAVKTANTLLEKARKSEQDPYLALLDWRNTPTETVKTSPVQRLFGRRTKTLLPTSSRLLKPKIPEDVDQKIKLEKAKQSLYFNEGARELQELRPGHIVRIQPQKSQVGKQKDWTRARVDGKVDIRSYQVRTEDGRIYRRNRRHLRRTQEVVCNREDDILPPPRESPCDEKPLVQPGASGPIATQEEQHTAPVQNADADKPQAGLPGLFKSNEPVIHASTTTTRSRRVVRPPTRFMDYQP